MFDSLYLAWRYICHHRVTTAVLVGSISLIAFLPAALEVFVSNAAEHFQSRSADTPLIVGPKGSSLELVLASLYFDRPATEFLRMGQLDRIKKQKIANAIPLHARYQARGVPVIGTTAEYLKVRTLKVADGRPWKMSGECVVGASAARQLDLRVGGRVPISSSSTFTLQDAPLRLNVVGILASTETPDDDAIFVNLETTWIVDGLGHGHAAGAEHGSPDAQQYTDITEQNIGSFHFHGNRKEYPITAIIAVPSSKKSETLLMGQYLGREEVSQIVRPSDVMDSLLAKIVMIRSYIVAVIAVVAIVTLLTIALVIVLSIRLRQRELVTMTKMGCSRFTIATNLGCQIAIILAASSVIAVALTWTTDAYGRELVRLLIL